MKPAERRQNIHKRLADRGVCSYEELSEFLCVSTMTVRRDVEVLAREGLATKALGGVQRAAPAAFYETDLRSRLLDHQAEKQSIARAVMGLVGGRRTAFLDGGSTCLELAKLLSSQRSGMTVITNSALACIELGKSRENMTVGIGGQYDAQSASFVGPSAEESASRFFVDLAIVSTKGFLADEGTFESAIATFHIKQIIARQAAKVILLIDHSKFGQRALSKVLNVSQIHAVVTDAAAPEADLERLRGAGLEIVVAGGEAGRAEDASGPDEAVAARGNTNAL
jgi:DeoR family transcriptional regulator of aga operon